VTKNTCSLHFNQRNSLFITSILTLSAGFAHSREINLKESFQLALAKSQSVSVRTDQILQTDAQIKQARSAYFPTLSFQAITTQQAESSNPLAKSLSSTRQSTSNLNLSQNLFRGFKDKASLNQKRNTKSADEWAKNQSIQLLYEEVASTFFSILILESDITLFHEQIINTRKRKEELSTARKNGRARDSEILVVDSSIAGSEASISQLESQKIHFQETLATLTGLPSSTSLVSEISLPFEVKGIDSWLQKKDLRPDVQQAKAALLATEENILIAKADYYPSIGLSANYYISRPTGIFQGVDWDTSLTLDFPFFSGGITRARVTEAKLIRHSQETLLRQTQGFSEESIRSAYRVVESDYDLLVKLDHSAALSKRSYELMHRDNRLGVATNTDVLSALQFWQEAKRNLERARITATNDYVKLLLESSSELVYE
jgi:outer membrane protein TolC